MPKTKEILSNLKRIFTIKEPNITKEAEKIIKTLCLVLMAMAGLSIFIIFSQTMDISGWGAAKSELSLYDKAMVVFFVVEIILLYNVREQFNIEEGNPFGTLKWLLGLVVLGPVAAGIYANQIFSVLNGGYLGGIAVVLFMLYSCVKKK